MAASPPVPPVPPFPDEGASFEATAVDVTMAYSDDKEVASGQQSEQESRIFVNPKDVGSLAPGLQLKDDALNLCLSLVVGALPRGELGLIPSLWSVASNMKRHIEPTTPTKGYLAPLHLVQAGHWVLLHVSTDGETVSVFDSAKSTQNKRQADIHSYIKQLASRHLRAQMNPDPTVEFLTTAQQKNGTDCGVFAITNAIRIATASSNASLTNGINGIL